MMLKQLIAACACTLCLTSSAYAKDAKVKIHVLDKDLNVVDGYNEKITIKNGSTILDPTKNNYCFETEKQYKRNYIIDHWCEYNTNSMNWTRTPVDTKKCWVADHKFYSLRNYCNDFIVNNKSYTYTVSRLGFKGYEANPNYTTISTGKITGERDIVFLPKGTDYAGPQVKSLPKPVIASLGKNTIEINAKPFNSTKYMNARGAVLSGTKIKYSFKVQNKKTKISITRTSASPKMQWKLDDGEYDISYYVSVTTKAGKYVAGVKSWSPVTTYYVGAGLDAVTLSTHLDRPPLVSTDYYQQLTRFHNDNGEHIYIGLPSFTNIVYEGKNYNRFIYEAIVKNVNSGEEKHFSQYEIKDQLHSHMKLKSGKMIGLVIPASLKKVNSIYEVQYRIGIELGGTKTAWTEYSDPGYIELHSSSGAFGYTGDHSFAPHLALPTPEVAFSAKKTVSVQASNDKIYIDGKTSVEVRLLNLTTGKTSKASFKLIGDNYYGKIFIGLSKAGTYKAKTIVHHTEKGDSMWSGTTEFVVK